MKMDHEQQMAQAEEVLGDAIDEVGFAKGLFFGKYLGERLLDYPDLDHDERADAMVAELGRYCREEIDAAAIDRDAEIPQRVIDGLGKLGVLGACLPPEFGGGGFSQTSYCRMIEVLGGHCGSTALFVNAHHSIGPRALVLFGTREQQAAWLPKMATGEWISAFALTEPEAGSDAANVQTTATPTADGRGYVLNGQKRWITNGGIAQVLTVMARTPVAGSKETKITAFLVTPDMPGFEVVEKRMPKCGVRGTATSRLAFNDMFVPKENILGSVGKGLRVALTVLDFGRTTFGASCTGAAKWCIEAGHAPRADARAVRPDACELRAGQGKAGLHAGSALCHGVDDLRNGRADRLGRRATSCSKRPCSRCSRPISLWRIVNDTIQIFGGKAYFTDEPYERMMRDARINMIGEGANDVLRVFTALVGMRDVGLELKGILDAAKKPLRNLGKLSGFAGRKIESYFSSPTVDVHNAQLENEALRLGKLIGVFGSQVEAVLRHYQESVLDRQFQLARIADSANELYACSCVLRRLDKLVGHGPLDEAGKLELATGRYYLQTAERRIHHHLDDLWVNDDEETTKLADMVLEKYRR